MGYKRYLVIWMWLVAFLVAGTYVSQVPIGKTSVVLIIFLIASLKAALVSLFYMHLRFERPIPVWAVAIFPFFLIGLATALIFLGIALS